MPKILGPARARSPFAVAVVIALTAAACGSTGPEDTAAEGPAAETTSSTSSTGVEEDTTGEDTGDETAQDGADEAAQGADEESDDAAEAGEATENLFPDVDVVDLRSGSTINLSTTLGGGDRPVLLWFWAPH